MKQVAIFILFFYAHITNALTGQEIFLKSKKALLSQDETSLVTLTITEKNQTQKSRSLNLSTLRKDHLYALRAKMLSPKDVAGMEFLGRIEKGVENQWIYLPSSKQVKRVLSGKRSGLLGSEIGPAELNFEGINAQSITILEQNKDQIVLQLLPKKGTSDYEKIVVRISGNHFYPLGGDYYSKGKLKKRIEFKNYVSFGQIWRPTRIEVKNVLNQRGTILEIKDLKINNGILNSFFQAHDLGKED